MKMSVFLRVLVLFLCGWVLSGCGEPNYDPIGTARTRVKVSDEDLAALPSAINLAELERRWGPREGQPGPRSTYRAADHPGAFFWVYTFSPQKAGKLLDEDVFVHHIVRADRSDENGTVVWPHAMLGQSPHQAAQVLMELGR